MARRYIPHNSALFVTSRTETGLPIVATHVMNLIIWGILARAKITHAVKVCHFLFMYNHFHMLIVAEDPNDVPRFIGYVKQEIAHSINRMLGRRKRTIWADSYDIPILLTKNSAINSIQYIYTNPAKADLVDTISDYPGVSSWDMFSNDVSLKKCKHVSRDLVPQLPFPALTINEQKRMASDLFHKSDHEFDFVLEPNAWMDCFSETREATKEQIKRINNQIFKLIEKKENKEKNRRKKNNIQVKGATALRRQSMLKEHTPEEYKQKKICHCEDKNLRKSFLEFFESLCKKAKEIYKKWKTGDTRLKMPPGLFAPHVPKLANDLPLKL